MPRHHLKQWYITHFPDISSFVANTPFQRSLYVEKMIIFSQKCIFYKYFHYDLWFSALILLNQYHINVIYHLAQYISKSIQENDQNLNFIYILYRAGTCGTTGDTSSSRNRCFKSETISLWYFMQMCQKSTKYMQYFSKNDKNVNFAIGLKFLLKLLKNLLYIII